MKMNKELLKQIEKRLIENKNGLRSNYYKIGRELDCSTYYASYYDKIHQITQFAKELDDIDKEVIHLLKTTDMTMTDISEKLSVASVIVSVINMICECREVKKPISVQTRELINEGKTDKEISTILNCSLANVISERESVYGRLWRTRRTTLKDLAKNKELVNDLLCVKLTTRDISIKYQIPSEKVREFSREYNLRDEVEIYARSSTRLKICMLLKTNFSKKMIELADANDICVSLFYSILSMYRSTGYEIIDNGESIIRVNSNRESAK